MDIVGRKKEIAQLTSFLDTSQSRLVVVSGRRRVGKTFLIDEVYASRMLFRHTAQSIEDLLQEKAPAESMMKAQIKQLVFSLQRHGYSCKQNPKNWNEAFLELEHYIDEHATSGKKVIFLDELPWLDTPHSRFFAAFMSFWSDYVLPKKGLILVVAGSANSWILDKLVENTGSLYKRHHCWINLSPFTLGETEEFLQSKSVRFSRYDIVQLYMALGGIPYYLDLIQKGQSVGANLSQILSSSASGLAGEFDSLFRSIFANPAQMTSIVRAMATKRIGLTKEEITSLTGIPDGGTLTNYLKALIASGFIMKYRPFGSSTSEKLYRVIDPFCLFFLRVAEKNGNKAKSLLEVGFSSPKLNAWKGLSFELVCFHHIKQIKNALNIGGVISEESVFFEKGDEKNKGAQIDMLINRDDNILNLCEAKFSTSKYLADSADQENLNRKIEVISKYLSPRHAIHKTLITTFGLAAGSYDSIFDNVITLDDLFK